MKILLLLFSLILISFSSYARGIKSNAIYGTDDRGFVTSDSPQYIKEISDSIGMIVASDSIDKGMINSIIKSANLNELPMQNMCVRDRFSTRKSIDACTGFLISEDLFVSAGHCFITEMDCKSKSIVFGVLDSTETNDGFKISNNNFYTCEKIIKSQTDSDKLIDFSIIRLNKKVHDRIPLKLSRADRISSEAKVFMIGHPMGMVQVYTKDSKIIQNTEDHYFKSSIDSFEGNSGSPVINSETMEVEGILVRGEEDFVYDQINQCNLLKNYDEDNLSSGESINRISDVINVLESK